jgi:VWFA-related protein
MKQIITALLLIFLAVNNVTGQSLSVFDVNTEDYPTIKAKFYAFDVSGNQITNLTESDFQITENGERRTVTYVSCPPSQPPLALSSVLTIDVSGSMAGARIGYAKAAATAWVNALPLGKSECAISSFHTANFFVQDFTTDINKLLSKINGLSAGGGTNYEAGFIDPKAGGLLVAEPGKYKKVLVFLSDGGPNFPPDEAKIIKKAQEDSVTVFCVTLGMKCPQCLKNISNSTGGQWFENITTKEQAEEVYRKILQQAQGGEPCDIEWLSEGCDLIRTAEIQIPAYSLSTQVTYAVPLSELPHLEISPSLSIRFGEVMPGTTKEEQITITAKVEDINVQNIKVNNTSYTITDYGGPPPPFTLAVDDSRTLTIEFAPQDLAYQLCKFEIESNACGVNKFYASGGDIFKRTVQQSIHLIHPNGGERFLVGTDTVITWEDVLPSDTVLLDYSTNGGSSWRFITDTASGLSYNWHVPDTPSDSCLARVSIGIKYEDNMVLIPSGTFRMGNTGAYSSDADEKPVHQVTISKNYLMSKYEITQSQYEAIMEKNPSFWKGDSLPVETVSWYDAVEFCNKLSDKDGFSRCYSGSGTSIVCEWNANGYRLPTEAEWEYACKAGTETDFHSGDLNNPHCKPIDANLDKIDWYCGNSGNKTHPVGNKEPNSFDLYDMSGNVYEWCWDWYDSNYYAISSSTDPKGESSGPYRVLRSGCWNSSAYICISSNRINFPDCQGNSIGFRIVRVP